MEIRNLVTFLHVAELNSFTKAADVLGYSQSTISFQIKQLENELGFPLFERINHTVALTERGREVLNYAHRLTQITAEFMDTLREEKELSGQIRLAMSDSLCNSLLRRHFPAFRAQYPGINLTIRSAGTEEMFRLIDHNETDAIMTLDGHIYRSDYKIVREEKIGVHFVVSSSHPLARKKDVSIRELIGRPFILTEKGMSYRRLLDEKLAGMSLEIRPVLEIGDVRLVCDLVRQGLVSLSCRILSPRKPPPSVSYAD